MFWTRTQIASSLRRILVGFPLAPKVVEQARSKVQEYVLQLSALFQFHLSINIKLHSSVPIHSPHVNFVVTQSSFYILIICHCYNKQSTRYKKDVQHSQEAHRAVFDALLHQNNIMSQYALTSNLNYSIYSPQIHHWEPIKLIQNWSYPSALFPSSEKNQSKLMSSQWNLPKVQIKMSHSYLSFCSTHILALPQLPQYPPHTQNVRIPPVYFHCKKDSVKSAPWNSGAQPSFVTSKILLTSKCIMPLPSIAARDKPQSVVPCYLSCCNTFRFPTKSPAVLY